MKLLLAILLTVPLSALAQFGAGVAAGGWEPLNIVTKAGIVACYDAGNASTITLNGTGVQQLRSRVVGVTNHLNQATAVAQPAYDTTNTVNGRTTLYFNGTTNFMKTAFFPWVQPGEVYFLCNLLSWSSLDTLFDGLDGTHQFVLIEKTNSPIAVLYAGVYGPSGDLTLGSYHVTRAAYASTNSFITVDASAPTIADTGTKNGDGFTLGALQNGTVQANMRFAHAVLCSKTNNTPEANFLRTCLMRRAGL